MLIKRINTAALIVPVSFFVLQYIAPVPSFAQTTTVMRTTPTAVLPSPSGAAAAIKLTPTGITAASTISAQEQASIITGGTLYQQFKSGQLSCQNLQNADLEKIGEYLMNQQMTGTMHAQTNQMLDEMIGNTGAEQVHILIAKHAVNCPEITPKPTAVAVTPAGTVMGTSTITALAGWVVAGILFLFLLISKVFKKKSNMSGGNQGKEEHITSSTPASSSKPETSTKPEEPMKPMTTAGSAMPMPHEASSTHSVSSMSSAPTMPTPPMPASPAHPETSAKPTLPELPSIGEIPAAPPTPPTV